MKPTDRHIAVLLAVRDGKRIVPISEELGVSQRTVTVYIKKLMSLGYIEQDVGPNGGGKWGTRRLTKSGKALLEKEDYDPEPANSQ